MQNGMSLDENIISDVAEYIGVRPLEMAGKLFENITAVWIMINAVLFMVFPETFSPHIPSIYNISVCSIGCQWLREGI